MLHSSEAGNPLQSVIIGADPRSAPSIPAIVSWAFEFNLPVLTDSLAKSHVRRWQRVDFSSCAGHRQPSRSSYVHRRHTHHPVWQVYLCDCHSLSLFKFKGTLELERESLSICTLQLATYYSMFPAFILLPQMEKKMLGSGKP